MLKGLTLDCGLFGTKANICDHKNSLTLNNRTSDGIAKVV